MDAHRRTNELSHTTEWDLIKAPSTIAEFTTAHKDLGIESLFTILHDGPDDACKRSATAWLFRHAYYQTHRQAIVECGGLDLLFHALDTASDYYLQLYAMGILAAIESDRCEPLDKDPETRRRLLRDPTLSDFAILFEAIGATQEETARVEALEMLACLFHARPDAPALADFVPRLVFLLRSPHAPLSAAAALTVIVLGTKYAARMANEGAVPLMVELVQHGDDQQKERAANALGVLVDGDRAIKAEAVNAGAMEALVELLREGVGEQTLSAALALANLAKRDADRQTAVVAAGAVAPMLRLMRQDCDAEKEAALFAIMIFDKNRRSVFSGQGVETALVQLLQSPLNQHKCRAAYLVAACVHGHRASQSAFARAGGVPPLMALLRDGSDHEKDAAVHAIVDLAHEHTRNTTLFLDAGLIELLVEMFTTDTTTARSTRSMAAKTLGTLAHGDGRVKPRMYQTGALASLVTMLRVENSDDSEKTQAAITLARLADKNEALAIEMAMLGALELLVEHLKASMDNAEEEGAVASLLALSFLSQPSHNQNVLLGLGIRNVLLDAEPFGESIRTLVANVRQNLRSSLDESTSTQSESCRVM